MGVDPHSATPIFHQIADHVRGAVAAGVYRPGEPIQSMRTLAVELRVNPNTVQRAFELLEREGLIQPRKGLGMFVTTNGASSARSKLEAAVYAAFSHGIRVGQAACLPAGQIRDSFEKAWKDMNPAQGDGQ